MVVDLLETRSGRLKESLRVIPRRDGFTNDRPAFGVHPREKKRGLDLRARKFVVKIDPAELAATDRKRREIAVLFALDLRAHLFQGIGHTAHRPHRKGRVPGKHRLKALAILDRQRSKHAPDVQVVTDFLPNYEPFVVWWGLLGPVGLPAPIANRIAAESKTALLQPDVTPKLNDLGLEVVGSTPEELAKLLRQDISTIGKLVKAIGLQPE